MNNLITKAIAFIKTHPARVYAFVVAITGGLPAVVAGVPVALVVAVASAVLLGGNAVQVTENGKTADAAAE